MGVFGLKVSDLFLWLGFFIIVFVFSLYCCVFSCFLCF